MEEAGLVNFAKPARAGIKRVALTALRPARVLASKIEIDIEIKSEINIKVKNHVIPIHRQLF